MSAINSNSDDRDLEAIRRAQRAHEPSMEEILASIRNIIADEREAREERRAQAGAAKGRRAGVRDRKSSTPRTIRPPQRVAFEPSQQRAESIAGERRERAQGGLAPAAAGRFRSRRRGVSPQ